MYKQSVRNSLPNAPSRGRYSENNREAVDEVIYPGEIELENEECNED